MLTGFSTCVIMKIYLQNLHLSASICLEHPCTTMHTTCTVQDVLGLNVRLGLGQRMQSLQPTIRCHKWLAKKHISFSSGLKTTTALLPLSVRAQRKQRREDADWGSSEESDVCYDSSWLPGHELVGFSLALKLLLQNSACPKRLCQQINVISDSGENS